MMKDKGGGEHAVEALNRIEVSHNLGLSLALKGDDEFPGLDAAMDVHARHGRDIGRG
nr:hypothetical protein [Neoroseomonas terrae]